jgi:hypothetical protein
MTEKTKLERIVAAGFALKGHWSIGPAGEPVFDHPVPSEAGVYAYVVDDEIFYVGSAQRGIGKRLRTYLLTQQRRTAFRIRGRIRQALEDGRKVAMYVIVPPPF